MSKDRRFILNYRHKKLSRLKTKELKVMAISNLSKMFANMTQFVYEAAMRVFSPNRDAYPEIGVQPFTGEIYKRGKAASW
jgi:hypothetical protein